MGETVELEPYYPGNGDWAGTAEIEVGFRLKRKETPDLFDSEQMQAAFINVSRRDSRANFRHTPPFR